MPYRNPLANKSPAPAWTMEALCQEGVCGIMQGIDWGCEVYSE